MDEKIECWEWLCKCGHKNYFIIGYTNDIICHRCWGYNMKYNGKKNIFKKDQMESMFPKK